MLPSLEQTELHERAVVDADTDHIQLSSHRGKKETRP